ncbi:MAG: hypothetical protein ABIH67_01375 [Candidatus Uhrbacteria bacterium]
MKTKKIIPIALIHALAVFLYTLLISWVMMNGESWFGQMDGMVGPSLMLLLLVVSATITGFLVLGRPIMLYLDNKKKDALKFLGFTIGWMLVIIVLTMTTLVIT